MKVATTELYPKGMTSRAAQREQTRARIIEGAIEAFAEHGFNGSSTRDNATRSDTSQGLVSYHFETKLDLWRAAADRIFADVADSVSGTIDGDNPPPEVVREAIRAFVRVNARRPELFHFMSDAGRHDNERLQYLIETHLPRFLTLVASVGHDDVDSAHLYYALAGASSLLFGVAAECRALTGVDPRDPVVIERHADYVARLFVP